MIHLDTSKYRNGFDEIYFGKIWEIISRPRKNEEASESDSSLCGSDITYLPLVKRILQSYVNSGTDDLLGIQKEVIFADCIEPEALKVEFRKLILADFSEIRKICENICSKTKRDEKRSDGSLEATDDEKNDFEEYKKLFDIVKNRKIVDVSRKRNKGISRNTSSATVKMSIRIVNELGLRTCPYCNKEYIGNRGADIMGATLDHFFSKSEFPFFAISLYNLIPSCNTCNSVKNKKNGLDMISPFDEVKLDDYVKFEYEASNQMVSLYSIKEVEGSKKEELKRAERTLQYLRLNEAYAFHSAEAKDFYDRMVCYNDTQLEEIQTFFKQKGIEKSVSELRKEAIVMAYGDLTAGNDAKRPLTKMFRDLYKAYERLHGVK